MTTGKVEISSYIVTYTNVKTETLSFNKQKKQRGRLDPIYISSQIPEEKSENSRRN
jgi:hypothetical protein